MIEDIYDPLEQYQKVFKEKFRQICLDTFKELKDLSKVDAAQNKKTCDLIRKSRKDLEVAQRQLSGLRFLCFLLWLLFAGGITYLIYVWQTVSFNLQAGIIAALFLLVVLLLAFVHPNIRKKKHNRDNLQSVIDSNVRLAWNQMEPLNKLFDWDILARMVTRTVPRIEFDPFFTVQRLADLKTRYGWSDSFNTDRSVIVSHSGLINGNPFVFCRTRKMEMGEKTYSGSLTITWTTMVPSGNGRMVPQHHSQVLTACVTAPYPQYYEKTRLIYGNSAAPDLIFNRRQNDLANNEDSLKFKRTLKKLQKFSRNLTDDSNYTMMTNQVFEVLFNTKDRNDEQQFRLLFTPLAQSSMLSLLRDEKEGYGDDFDFCKDKKINTIIADHLQNLSIDTDPKMYHGYDLDDIEKNFYSLNAEHFRSLYFGLAPLLSIPMYQQIRPVEDIYGIDMPQRSAFWEHESLANFWGEEHFRSKDCVTECILKTQELDRQDNTCRVQVSAHGFGVIQRTTYVPKLGMDGRMHQVPVHWDEYYPVVGTGDINIKEVSPQADATLNPLERVDFIANQTDSVVKGQYRRHITSHLS
ncbi:MAG: hypothetical protein MJY71_05195 [Bacteroidaceae bacterium]|nr:hypothetical protein [Bacteroidaceae bacterium]